MVMSLQEVQALLIFKVSSNLEEDTLLIRSSNGQEQVFTGQFVEDLSKITLSTRQRNRETWLLSENRIQ